MSIEYDHSKNLHTLAGPKAAFPRIFSDGMPGSILDVGCGAATWLRAAQENGVTDILGIDGEENIIDELFIDQKYFRKWDLSSPVSLERKFDVALCLEVAEHLEEKYAHVLIQTLVTHADRVVFSAACPGQPGQHHVNCQWPAYWQKLFNAAGFACEDSLRWIIWDASVIEPWYRQNMFLARRSPESGKEPRIHPVIHPEILPNLSSAFTKQTFATHVVQIEHGRMPWRWYPLASIKAFRCKILHHLK